MIYVAGPITTPSPMHNTHTALKVGAELLDTGWLVPFVPHLLVLWDIVIPRHYEEWMQLDFDIIHHCQALYRIHGESPGADREMQLAKDLGLAIFAEDDPKFRLEVIDVCVQWAMGWAA